MLIMNFAGVLVDRDVRPLSNIRRRVHVPAGLHGYACAAE